MYNVCLGSVIDLLSILSEFKKLTPLESCIVRPTGRLPYLMLRLSLLSCLQQDVLLFIDFVFPLFAYLLLSFAFNIFGNGIYLVFNVYFELCRRRMCINFYV